MFSAVGHVDTTMMETTMEEASELMQDVSKTASDMEMEEQKKREQTAKQMQEISMVTLDTALPEQKKIQNEPTATKQAPVKALFSSDYRSSAFGNTHNYKSIRYNLKPYNNKGLHRGR